MKKAIVQWTSVGCLWATLLICTPASWASSKNASDTTIPDDGINGVQVNVQVSQDGSASAPPKVTAAMGEDSRNRTRQEQGAVIAQTPQTNPTISQQPKHKIFQYMPDSSKSYGTESMLSELSKEVAGKVYYELKEEGQRNLTSRVAVVAAVPLSDLKRETEFGRVIAEYYLTDLADRGIQVKELRLGKDINILPQTGEFILSRNIGEIANNSPALDYVVVSTFTNTRKTIILQGRLVSLKTGLVKSTWRHNLPLNRELLGLFYSAEQPFTVAVKGIDQ